MPGNKVVFTRTVVIVAENDEGLWCLFAEPFAQRVETRHQHVIDEFTVRQLRPVVWQQITTEENRLRFFVCGDLEQLVVSIDSAVEIRNEDAAAAH
jgi:hypothetical protein